MLIQPVGPPDTAVEQQLGGVDTLDALLDTYALLAQAMLDDPFLALANAVAWLDPLWQMPEDYEYEEGEDAAMALDVTRSVFPDIYAGAVERIRAGATYAELEATSARRSISLASRWKSRIPRLRHSAARTRDQPFSSLSCTPSSPTLPVFSHCLGFSLKRTTGESMSPMKLTSSDA